MDQVKGLSMVCMLEGAAVMTRKDSQLPPQWNVGFNKARSNGRFQKICADTPMLHGKQYYVCVRACVRACAVNGLCIFMLVGQCSVRASCVCVYIYGVYMLS